MYRYLYYLGLSIGLMSIMVGIKLWVVPFTLWNLFPQSDLVSKLYEVFIMAMGGLTFLLFIILGYVGKHGFDFRWGIHLLLHFIIQLPFAFHAFLQEVTDISYSLGFMESFADGWCGLIAEPTRLLLMVYPWTDIFAIVTSFIFLYIGRQIEIVDEEKLWERNRNRVKVGRT